MACALVGQHMHSLALHFLRRVPQVLTNLDAAGMPDIQLEPNLAFLNHSAEGRRLFLACGMLTHLVDLLKGWASAWRAVRLDMHSVQAGCFPVLV